MRDVVLVVTPTHNAEPYLEQTILSVVQQRGDFEIRYHVQDGGSTDSTPAIARAWMEHLTTLGGRFHGSAEVIMSYGSGRDRSMFDAIQTGFERLFGSLDGASERRVVMTWLNADDIFTAGAFQTVLRFMCEVPDQHWVTGIPSVILEDGTIGDVRQPPHVYTRKGLALGTYDGRSNLFLQQEGTFWTRELWSRAGGLNRGLSLAGDWDLWRRMAGCARVVTLRAVLAHHRRHSSQLSSDMAPYWAEVDALKQLDDPRAGGLPDEGDIGWAAGWEPETRRWNIHQVHIGADQRRSPGLDVNGVARLNFSTVAMPLWIRDASGLSTPEEWGRWSDAALAPSVRLAAWEPFPPRATIRVKLAVAHPSSNPVFITIGRAVFELQAAVEPKAFAMTLPPDLVTDTIDIRVAQEVSPRAKGWSNDSRRLGVALHFLEIAPAAS